ncbi:photosynthetic complex putative assembly protein PuhB [Histidinibacterium lentulum]|uniref:PH domain-containing protein n=1 Tax=Histidinibacterium lentulum TaxID=2480588 RepID=A0A3N2R6W1_9RHOB|nr:photosynthetic complex putative assembly protein PuhB [Histidinibacterium lentulum]ROU03111.1 PH domain-containing protein [Histidinibacterium lentulum]
MHHDDFNFEPVRGLPAALPPDEHILWQGAPEPRRLAREALALDWIMAYFAILIVWRVGVSSTLVSFPVALTHAVPFVIAAVVTAGILYGIAYMQARSTVYTLTNKRVAMRIGAALTMTLNVPYVKIGNADLQLRRDGTGTIAFETIGDARISYLMTWPHVRPWYFRTQPALRCIPDAQRVAAIFAEAAEARVSQPRLSQAPATGGAADTIAAE